MTIGASARPVCLGAISSGGSSCNQNHYLGLFDELAIFNRALSAAEVQQIYVHLVWQFTSRVIDGGGSSSWTNLSWSPSSPQLKELPNNAQIETDYGSGNVDMTGNVLLFHLNEGGGSTSFADTSGSANNGSCVGVACPVMTASNANPPFGNSASFAGAQEITVPVTASLNVTPNVSVSAWIQPQPGMPGFATVLFNGDTGGNFSYVLGYDAAAAHFRFLIGDGLGGFDSVVAPPLLAALWHHVVGVADAIHVSLYMDGVLAAQVPRTVVALGNAVHPVCIGAQNGGGNCNGDFYLGSMDEVAVFGRALPASEVSAMYNRGEHSA